MDADSSSKKRGMFATKNDIEFIISKTVFNSLLSAKLFLIGEITPYRKKSATPSKKSANSHIFDSNFSAGEEENHRPDPSIMGIIPLIISSIILGITLTIDPKATII